MEGRGGGVVSSSGGGVTVLGSDAPSEYHVASRPDNPTHVPFSTATAAGTAGEPLKKKRGRPRKHFPGGSPPNMVLSPKPISSAAPELAPAVIDFSAPKRGKLKPCGPLSKSSFGIDSLGESVPCNVGTNFMPHIINVNTGEDVMMKIISFSQQGPRSICILSANGTISSVTLRQPDSCGGTLTYEGRFEILSLTGSFTPNESGGTKSRSGGMSVSLSSPDGRVIGGGVAGLLVAAGPIQNILDNSLGDNPHIPTILSENLDYPGRMGNLPWLGKSFGPEVASMFQRLCFHKRRNVGIVVGSFISGNEQDDKPKRKKHESISTFSTTTVSVPFASTEPRHNNSTSPTFGADNWSFLGQHSRNKTSDNNGMLP